MEEEQNKRHYRIEVGDKIKVKRQDYNNYVFYKVAISKKNIDGTTSFFDKNIAFNSGVDLKDGTYIIVKDFFEDVFVRKNDKYNANWTLHITDFDIIEGQEPSDAIAEYQNKVNGVELNNDSIVIKDSDIPF